MCNGTSHSTYSTVSVALPADASEAEALYTAAASAAHVHISVCFLMFSALLRHIGFKYSMLVYKMTKAGVTSFHAIYWQSVLM